MDYFDQLIDETADLLKSSRYTVAFTGAGISVESGIPPFRGDNGIWNKYNPQLFDIHYFTRNSEESWKVIKEIFFDTFVKASPNPAHLALAKLESNKMLEAVITQNIDSLHQIAGNRVIYEFHGNSRRLVSIKSKNFYNVEEVDLNTLPPRCPKTGEILKPDFIFFGEGIPYDAYTNSVKAAASSQVFLVIGTTGEIMPASQLPFIAKQNGAKIVELNIKPSNYTSTITDIYLEGKASETMNLLVEKLGL